MPKLIDAEKLHLVKFQDASDEYRMGWNDALNAIIENEPTVDFALCKDCEKSRKWGDQDTLLCYRDSTTIHVVKPDAFCDESTRKRVSDMAHWIDNADGYICSECGYETNNPNKEVYGAWRCPKCGVNMNI